MGHAWACMVMGVSSTAWRWVCVWQLDRDARHIQITSASSEQEEPQQSTARLPNQY